MKTSGWRAAATYAHDLIEASLDPFAIIGADGKIIDANAATAQATGLPREQLRGTHLADYFTEPDRVREAYQRACAEGFVRDYPLAIRHVSGRITDVLYNASVSKDAKGNVLGVFAAARDVTERRQAEKAFHDSGELYRSLVENLPQSIFRKNRAGHFVFCNQRFCEDVGHPLPEIVGKTDADFFPPELATAYRQDDLHVMESGQALDRVEEHVGKNGRMLFVQVVKTPLRDASGNIIGVQGIFWDVTARETAEAQLQRHLAEIQAANNELEAFSYSVAHDLRTPLRHVQGFADLLMRETEGQLSERGRGFLKAIAAATMEMAHLIDDLLAFSRMGRAEMREADVNLDALVQDTLRALEEDTRARSIVWKISPLPTVQGDPAMLKLVWANLLANAVKFTRPRNPAEIEVGASGREGDRVVLFVRDNGVGFDMKCAKKLFGVFQRLHRIDEFEGTGIGLANVRHIIARHGGRTWAEGVLDQGATFYFTLKPSSSTKPANLSR